MEPTEAGTSAPLPRGSRIRRAGHAVRAMQASVWVPAALLIAVAVGQIALARMADLTPWKGGGFGMFATTDRPGSRYVRVHVSAPGRAEELAMPAELRDLERRTAALPTGARLAQLGRQLARREHEAGRGVRSVRVEAWRVEFEPDSLVATSRKLREIVVAVDQLD